VRKPTVVNSVSGCSTSSLRRTTEESLINDLKLNR
jgi:hypothetical protein